MPIQALTPVELVLRSRTTARVLEAEGSLTRAQEIFLFALLLALALAAAIAFWLTRSISGPVRALEKGMGAVADGELDHTLGFRRRPRRRVRAARRRASRR